MARVARRSSVEMMAYTAYAGWAHPISARLRGLIIALMGVALVAAFATYHATDPSFNAASAEQPLNALGGLGAVAADLGLQSLGLGAWLIAATMVISGGFRVAQRNPAAFRWTSADGPADEFQLRRACKMQSLCKHRRASAAVQWLKRHGKPEAAACRRMTMTIQATASLLLSVFPRSGGRGG